MLQTSGTHVLFLFGKKAPAASSTASTKLDVLQNGKCCDVAAVKNTENAYKFTGPQVRCLCTRVVLEAKFSVVFSRPLNEPRMIEIRGSGISLKIDICLHKWSP